MDIIVKIKENKQISDDSWYDKDYANNINDEIKENIINNDKRKILLEILLEFASYDAAKIIIDYTTHSKYNDAYYDRNTEGFNYNRIDGGGPIPLNVIEFDWEYFIKQINCRHTNPKSTFWNHHNQFYMGCGGYKQHLGELAGRSNLYIQCPICWAVYGFNIMEEFKCDGVVIIKFDQYYMPKTTYIDPINKKENPITFRLSIL